MKRSKRNWPFIPLLLSCGWSAGCSPTPAQNERGKTPTRRWWRLRWTMRTMFAVVTIINIIVGLVSLVVLPSEKQKKALASMKEIGGFTIHYDYGATIDLPGPKHSAPFLPFGGPQPSQSKPPGPEWLRDWAGVDYFANVVAVDVLPPDSIRSNWDLWGTNVDDEIRDLRQFKKLEALDLTSNWVTDRGVDQIVPLRYLRRLHFRPTQITDAALAKLSVLKQLRELSILHPTFWHPGDSKITDDGLAHIGKLTKLQTLHVCGSAITDDGLRHFSELTELTDLTLSVSGVSGDGLKHLADKSRLKSLNLAYSPATDDGLRQLVGMSSLETLDLGKTAISDQGLKHLANLLQLTELNLHSTKITGKGLWLIAGLKKLKKLNLSGTFLSDSHLRHLHSLTNLTEFNLTATHVTDDGVASIKKALPNCKIDWNSQPILEDDMAVEEEGEMP